MDFRISEWISGFQIGFLDFNWSDFWISDWISADSVRDFFCGGPLAMPCMEVSTVLDIPMHLGCASLESRLPFLFGVGSGSETVSAQE